jgi:hypothetical protein
VCACGYGGVCLCNSMYPSHHIQHQRYLAFATTFTPQFGDSFIELMRLTLLERGPLCAMRHKVRPDMTPQEIELIYFHDIDVSDVLHKCVNAGTYM